MTALEWLLVTDPAMRWQVMRDLTNAPTNEVAAERAPVAHEGWGAQLLAAQRADAAMRLTPHGIINERADPVNHPFMR